MSTERMAAMRQGREKAMRKLIQADARYVKAYYVMLREDADRFEEQHTWGAMRMAAPTDTQFAHYHEAIAAAVAA